jgi:hypothetical protein
MFLGKEQVVIGRRHEVWIVGFVSACLMAAALLITGCGSSPAIQPNRQAVVDAASGFLNAVGDLDLGSARSFFSQDYLEANQVPDPLTQDDLFAVMGSLSSYKLDPASDVSLQGNKAIVTVALDIANKGEKTETLIMIPEAGAWKVASFTAMDWNIKPQVQATGDVEVEKALRDFVVACIDAQTGYVFANLSSEYKKQHHLQQAWTTAEFSGIFGTARSYNFNPQEIAVEGDRAGVDVTIEFGSRGNLQTETSRVELVKEGRWRIDVFSFFIY